jgi:hypothetical protein
VKCVANLAEVREGQISFTSLDSSKETPVQSTILGKAVLAKPMDLTVGLFEAFPIAFRYGEAYDP